MLTRQLSRRLAGPLAAALLVGGLLPVLLPAAADAQARRARAPRQGTAAGGDDERASQEAFKHFQFGSHFYQQGLLQQAQESLQRALTFHPSYSEALYMLALVHLELKDFRRAIGFADEALRHNHFFTEAHNVKGMAHAMMGSHVEALREFQVVLADVNFPTPEVAHFNIGLVFWEQGACGDAVLHFRRALEVNRSFARGWHLLGDCQELLGMVADARASYEQAVTLEPEAVAPRYRLGYLCFTEGDRACAERHFERVRALAPASEEARAAREYVRQMNFR